MTKIKREIIRNFLIGFLAIKRPTGIDPDSVFFRIGVKTRRLVKGERG